MTATFVTIPVPAWKLRAGDLIRPAGRDEKVASVSGIEGGTVVVRIEAASVVMPAWHDVPTVMPVGRPSDGVGLYKVDGSGPLGCVCVYRAPSGGQPHDLVHEVDDCPWHNPTDEEE